MRMLSKSQLVEINEAVVTFLSGEPENKFMAYGVKKEAELEHLTNTISSSVMEEYYPLVEEKAAKLFTDIKDIQPFNSANKETAMIAMIQLLKLNGKKAEFNQQDLINLKNSNNSYEETLEFINNNLVKAY